MTQTRGFRAGTRSGAAAARAKLRSLRGSSSSTQDRSGARGSGSGVGGTITPADYTIKHGEGFGTSQPESLAEGLSNIYGGQASLIRDKDTGALVTIDSDTNEAVLIEPPGGLSEAQRKKIIDTMDKQGDVPNITETVTGGFEDETVGPTSDFWGGDSFFGGDSYSQEYTEGDASSTTGGSGGGKVNTGILLIGVVVLGALYLFFGRGGK
jgi:hypothetical protein